jgi:hypothetical protein
MTFLGYLDQESRPRPRPRNELFEVVFYDRFDVG